MQIKSTLDFTSWLDALKDLQARARILTRIRRLGEGNAGDHKALEGGVSELKIDFGPGYRVYYTKRGRALVILLVGGDKSSQQADIRKAIKLAAGL